MNFVKKALVASVAAVALASAAEASTFKLTPIISAKYDSTSGVLLQGALNGPGLNSANPSQVSSGGGFTGGLYEVDIYLGFTPSAGQPSFGNVTYNLVPGGGTTRLASNVSSGATLRSRNYLPVNTGFDSDLDGSNDQNMINFNADAGSDWLAVLNGIDTTIDTSAWQVTDPRPAAGQPAGLGSKPNGLGLQVGRAYVNWDGSTNGTFAQVISPPLSGSPPFYWNSPPGNNLQLTAADIVVQNGSATFTAGAVPEPASILAGSVFAGLALLRRRNG